MKEEPKVYLARAGRNGEDEDYALENNLALIGFEDVLSLEGARDYDAVVKLVRDGLPGLKPRALGNFSGQLWAFALAMQEGDIVVLPRKLTSQIAIGRVTGPYRYDRVNKTRRHTRPVAWLQTELPRTTFEQDLLYSFGAFMMVCNISRNAAARRVTAVLEGKPGPGLFLLVDQLNGIVAADRRKRIRTGLDPNGPRSDRRAYPVSLQRPRDGPARRRRAAG